MRHKIRPKTLSLQDRIDSYVRVSGFPETLMIGEDGRICGIWVMGNNYQVKNKYWGGYRPTYLKRIKSLFPEKHKVLHLFSGMVDTSIIPGDTCDINPKLKPTYVDDAQTLTKVPLDTYSLIIGDPPYSKSDADTYGTTMIKRNKVMNALARCKSGTFIVWLDMTLPMYRKEDFEVIGYIGIVGSTNHRVRLVTIFRRR